MSNITIIGINYYPEDSAIGLYTTQMAEFLSENGFNVSVVTGFPYYPQWRIHENYLDKPKRISEQINGIEVYRYKQFVPEKPTFFKRILHLLDFSFGSLRNIFKIKNSDLVICIVPFTTTIILGKLLAMLKGAKLWIHVQDFEFDVALESGIVGGKGFIKKIIFKFLFLIEKFLLNRADVVSSISLGMMKKMKSKTKVDSFLFPNWIDDKFIVPEKRKRHPYLQSDKFKVLYSGNVGAKQDWDFFLEVVEQFKDDENIEFVVVGDGAKKDWLVENVKKFENVFCFNPLPYEQLPDLLCSADLHILFQKSSVVDTVMPSKLLGMMASGKPSLITGSENSEVASIFENIGCKGFFPSNKNEIIDFIHKLKNDTVLCKEIGNIEKKYIEENFLKSKILKRFNDKIIKLMK